MPSIRCRAPAGWCSRTRPARSTITKMEGKRLPLLRFSDNSPVYFDRHTLSLKAGVLSMYTLDGRMRCELPLAPRDEVRFHQNKLREVVLSRRADGVFELLFTFIDAQESAAVSRPADRAAPQGRSPRVHQARGFRMKSPQSSELAEALAVAEALFQAGLLVQPGRQPAGARAHRLHAGGVRPRRQQPQPPDLADADAAGAGRLCGDGTAGMGALADPACGRPRARPADGRPHLLGHLHRQPAAPARRHDPADERLPHRCASSCRRRWCSR